MALKTKEKRIQTVDLAVLVDTRVKTKEGKRQRNTNSLGENRTTRNRFRMTLVEVGAYKEIRKLLRKTVLERIY